MGKFTTKYFNQNNTGLQIILIIQIQQGRLMYKVIYFINNFMIFIKISAPAFAFRLLEPQSLMLIKGQHNDVFSFIIVSMTFFIVFVDQKIDKSKVLSNLGKKGKLK